MVNEEKLNTCYRSTFN